MSADNGIYIAKFPDGYRVTYAAAIENIDYYPVGTVERKNELKKYFGESNVYQNIKDALNDAYKIKEVYEYTEYGICILTECYELFNE